MKIEPQNAHILIVDDAPQNIQVVANILHEQGYCMAFALNGKSAVEHCLTSHFDLILLDVMMPEMNGYDVCGALKANPATREIPIIFLTARADGDSVVKGFEVGGVDYVTKPFNAAELIARVNTHLAFEYAQQAIEAQNRDLLQAARLREDVERIMRHDLKTPLSAIIGFAEVLLERSNINDEQAEFIKKIQESGYTMLRMVNLSLDLFKMEQGQYHVTPSAVDIIALVRRIGIELRRQLAAKDAVFTVSVDGHPAKAQECFWVLGEELLCYTMLTNLIKNAVEASPKEENISVVLLHGDQAAIRIHNAGMVPFPIRERFFEKYVTYGKDGDGTGLGTYSAKLFAEIQGGRIEMSTSEEKGTTMTVWLPIPVGREVE